MDIYVLCEMYDGSNKNISSSSSSHHNLSPSVLTFVAVSFLVLNNDLSFQHSRAGQWHPCLQLQHNKGGSDTSGFSKKLHIDGYW